MKYIILLLFTVYLQVSCASDNEQSNNIQLYASTHSGERLKKPENWLRFYEHENNTIENRIYLTAEFNIENAVALVVTDLNAEKKMCGKKQKKFLVYLAFDPDVNLKKITIRTRKPCFVENAATLKLSIKTQDGQRFFKVTELKAHPDAFNPVSE